MVVRSRFNEAYGLRAVFDGDAMKRTLLEDAALTTKAMIVVGSSDKALYRIYGQPTQYIVLVVEGRLLIQVARELHQPSKQHAGQSYCNKVQCWIQFVMVCY